MKRQARPSRMWVLGVTAVAAVTFAVGYSLAPQPQPQWAQPPALTNHEIPVTVREYRGIQALTASISMHPEHQLTTVSTGTLRRTYCQPGSPLYSGQILHVIDDRPVMVLHTAMPLWRDLAAGMRGDDVSDLQAELNRLGHQIPVNGIFGPATEEALRQVWDNAGGPDNQRTLPIGQVIWLDQPQLVPSHCLLEVGQLVRVGQDAVIVGGGLESVSMAHADLPGANMLVQLPGSAVSVPLPADGVITDPAFLEAIASRYTAEQLGAQDVTSTAVTVQLATPLQVAAVPPSALFHLTGSDACVMSQGQSIPVEVIASELGQSLVLAPVDLDTVVILPESQPPCR